MIYEVYVYFVIIYEAFVYFVIISIMDKLIDIDQEIL